MIDVGFFFLIVAIIIAAATLIFLAYDYFFYQKSVFNGRKYRRENAKFSIDRYVKNSVPIKEDDWIKQRNNGIKPELYKGKNKYTKYSKNVECIVLRKGL